LEFFYTQAQPTRLAGVSTSVRSFSEDSKSLSSSIQSTSGEPALNPEPLGPPDFEASQPGRDEKLDALLGSVPSPILSAGFAARVIHSVAPAHLADDCATKEWATKAAPPTWARTLWTTAAAVALCGALLWWNNYPSGHRLPVLTSFSAGPTEEEVLLKALTTLEINSGDLALVAQLGEVLEAELAEKTSWLEID
jgi:hypothetical protein